jgi:hypothetical protein
MNELDTAILPHRAFKPLPFVGLRPAPTGQDSALLHQATLEALSRVNAVDLPQAFTVSEPRAQPVSLKEQLYEARAACKVKTAAVAMHLPPDWRTRFFSQIDGLLDIESWDPEDQPATVASFATLLRMILFIRGRRPGLGATASGNFIATWTEGRDELTIECKPDDKVRWVLVRDLDGQRESAAGETSLPRLLDVLRPYDPHRWFRNAPDQAAP